MNMFSNYQLIPENYTPCNTYTKAVYPQSYTALVSDNLTKPFELYDAKGELEGYTWGYGDTIELSFNIAGFTIIDNGSEELYEDIDTFLEDKNITLILYDFRFNPLYIKTKKAKSNIIFFIDTELSKKLVKGIYYCSLTATGDKFHQTIFDSTDCKFIVK